MKLSQLKIDPEFQSKIPPLQFEEEQQLEQNIIAEGRLLNPISTWNGYILDGNTRYRILENRKGGEIMMNSNLNLSALPECKFAYQMVNSALLIPCAEYQRVLHVEKVAHIAENFSEYVANEPKVSFRDGRFYIFDGQNTVEARRTCNGGMELPIRCKVFYGLTKEDEATLFAIRTGNATCLTADERLRANLVAENPDALYFVGITSNAGVEFAYDGIRAPWKIYCIETAYELYKQYGCERYVEMLRIINEAWKGNVDSYASKAEMLRIDMALLVSLALNILSGNRSE